MLRMLQTSDIGNYLHFDTYDPIIPILGVEIYLEIEKRKESERQDFGVLSDRSQSISESLIAECEHIHNKAIFDCINESLNQFRPYGKEGVPMMWSNKLRKLREDEILEFSKMFEIIKQDLLRWSFTWAGTLPKREFVYYRQRALPFGGSGGNNLFEQNNDQISDPQSQTYNKIIEEEEFDIDYFEDVREKRLAALLASDVIENEYKWINYDFEESQVKIDIGDMIMEQIITETKNLINEIGSQNNTASIYSDGEIINRIFNVQFEYDPTVFNN